MGWKNFTCFGYKKFLRRATANFHFIWRVGTTSRYTFNYQKWTEAVSNAIYEWNRNDKVQLMCCYTAPFNTSLLNGYSVRLEEKIEAYGFCVLVSYLWIGYKKCIWNKILTVSPAIPLLGTMKIYGKILILITSKRTLIWENNILKKWKSISNLTLMVLHCKNLSWAMINVNWSRKVSYFWEEVMKGKSNSGFLVPDVKKIVWQELFNL